MIAAKPTNEEARLAALRRYDVMDTPPELAFDEITRLVSYICDTPVALITFLDETKQFLKSEIGAGRREVPVEMSLCSHALLQPGVTVVPDTTQDERFADNPMVVGDPNLRFYAGALLETSDGLPIGTLCVLDVKARTLTPAQIDALQILAHSVMSLMELRRSYKREKNIAETLQRSMLLPPKASQYPGLDVETLYESAWSEAAVGGDFFDVSALADGSVALVIGDVAGKGLSAATRTAEAKYALRVYLRESSSPTEAVSHLNRFLCDSFGDEDDTFIALSVAVIAPDGGCRVVLAGSESPLLHRADGTTETLFRPGLPVGVLPETVYTAIETRLDFGDTLLLLTDGITEARQGRGGFWGGESVARILETAVPGAPLADTGETIVREARAFAAGTLRDDVCLLLARRCKK
ncbi:MAG: SpoIIE family protein phosphatase [Armatimonadetes bacterium]|nr:SpoIIE family protein phosphatase [Armatimonadota bacterium]